MSTSARPKRIEEEVSGSERIAFAVSGAALTPCHVHNLHLFLHTFGEGAGLRYLEDLAYTGTIEERMRAELKALWRVA